MINGIPMIGIAHDIRLPDLFDDIGIKQDLCFEYDKLQLSLLSERADQVLAQSSDYHKLLLECYKSHFIRAKRNKELLVSYLSKFGGICFML